MKTILILFLALCGMASAVEVFVAPDGNDAAGDGSTTRPFASLQRALQNAVPGTVVTLKPGTYRGGIQLRNLAGTARAPIRIRGAADQPRPVIRGGASGIQFSHVRYLAFEHVEIAGAKANGINCDDGGAVDDPTQAQFIVFRDLYIHDIGDRGNHDGIKLSGVDDYKVLNCVIERTGGYSSSGIDQVGCHRGVIEGCTFRELSGNAIQCKGGSADILITRCRIEDVAQRGVNMGGSTGIPYYRPSLSKTKPNVEARDIRVIANIFERCSSPVCFVGCRDSLVANNTMVHPRTWFWRILQEQNGDATYRFLPAGNSRFVNNLVYFARSDLKSYDTNVGGNVDADSFTFAHNLWYAYDAPGRSQPRWLKPETGSVVGKDPRLADVGKGDYALRSDSPARGAGVKDSGVKADFRGRSFASPPAMGAFGSK